jgi:hypothetical protein
MFSVLPTLHIFQLEFAALSVSGLHLASYDRIRTGIWWKGLKKIIKEIQSLKRDSRPRFEQERSDYECCRYHDANLLFERCAMLSDKGAWTFTDYTEFERGR